MSKKGVKSGAGVAREEEPNVEEAPEVGPAYEEVKDADGMLGWSDKPTFADQYHRYPETCKKGPSRIAVFVLTDKVGLDACNELLVGATPSEAPHIILEDSSREFHEGMWSYFVRYREVSYKKLIKRR